MIKRQSQSSKEQLRTLKDIQLIEVVTSIRRCGESTLFELFRNKLTNSGVQDKCIQHCNLEDPDNTMFLNWRNFYDYIKMNLTLYFKGTDTLRTKALLHICAREVKIYSFLKGGKGVLYLVISKISLH